MMFIFITLWLPLLSLGQPISLDAVAYPPVENPPVDIIQPISSPPVNTQPENSQPEVQPQDIPQETLDVIAVPQDTTNPDAISDTLSAFESRRMWAEFEANRQLYETARERSYFVIGVWLTFMTVTMIYLFIRYQFYSGLKRRRYWQLVNLIDADETIAVSDKPQFYPQNPYKDDTLGMPTGTIRAFLTLTLLIANCLVLYVSVYAPPSAAYAQRTEFIATAFLMMIAFYFGSRAVDVFKSREDTRRKSVQQNSVDPYQASTVYARSAPPPSPKPAVAPRPPEARPATSPVQLTSSIPDSKTVKTTAAAKKSLEERIFATTAFFETGKSFKDAFSSVAGDFDGMGISMGCLHWNLGQGTLQPILLDYFKYTKDSWQDDPNLVELKEMLGRPVQEQINWARSIQTRNGNTTSFKGNWGESLKKLAAQTKDFQLKACEPRFDIARNWCQQLGLTSERALALMFDINVQNGSLFKSVPERGIDVRSNIQNRIATAGAPSEEDRLVIIAEERARASSSRWQKDVLNRKLAIARGRGTIHGSTVDLSDFGIRLDHHFS